MADKIKIMIVDDNVANLKLAGDLLEMEGIDVCRCVDAENAIEALEQFHPALILMDIALPGMDGEELTRKLKSEENTKDIVIVALTASAMKGDRERILKNGCNGYMAKPINTRTFMKEVMHYL